MRVAGAGAGDKLLSVLHFAETLPGGPATYLNELLAYQIRHYGKVTLFCPDEQAAHIRCPGAEIVTFSGYRRSALGILKLLRDWHRFIRGASFDVVHLHSSFAGALGRLVEQRREARLVYCAHGWSFARDIGEVKKRVYSATEAMLSRRTDVVVNISKSERSLAVHWGLPAENSVVVYNGLADVGWEPLPVGRRLKKLLFVGRYDRQKGLDLLLQAMESLGAKGFELDCIGAPVVGRGLSVKFPSAATDYGWLDQFGVSSAMERADAIVVPSRWEGFGLVAAEAMRAGRPVVAARVGGLSELVVEGETGILFEKNSVDGLIGAVETLAGMNIRQVGINGRHRYESHFTAEKMFVTLDRLYRNPQGR